MRVNVQEFWTEALAIWDAADRLPRRKGLAEGAKVRQSLVILSKLDYDSRPPWETSAPRGYIADHDVAWFRRDSLNHVGLPLSFGDQLFDQKNNLYQRTTLHAQQARPGAAVLVVGGGIRTGKTSLKVLGITSELELADLDEMDRSIRLLPFVTRYDEVPDAPFLCPVEYSAPPVDETAVRLVQALGADPPTRLTDGVWNVVGCALAPDELIVWVPRDDLSSPAPLRGAHQCLVVATAELRQLAPHLRLLVRQHDAQLRFAVVDRAIVQRANMYWDWCRDRPPIELSLRSRTWEEQRAAVFLAHVCSVFAAGVDRLRQSCVDACAAAVWREYALGRLALRAAWRVLVENHVVAIRNDTVALGGVRDLGRWVLDWCDPSLGSPDQCRELPVMLDVVDWIMQTPSAFVSDEYNRLLVALLQNTAESLRIKRATRALKVAEQLLKLMPLDEVIHRGVEALTSHMEAGATLLSAVWIHQPERRDEILMRLDEWAIARSPEDVLLPLLAMRWRVREQEAFETLLTKHTRTSWITVDYPRVGY